MALQRVRSNMLANNFVLDDDQGLIVGSGNNIYIDTINNRVGINTNSPTHELTVNGDISATTFYGDGSQLTGLSSTLDEVTTNGDTTTNSITVGGLIVNSSGALGLPVGTTAERPTAADGLIRFNSDLVAFEGYDGVEWGALGGGGATYSNTAPSTNLKEGDLWFDTGTTGELYVYSGTEWLSVTGSGGAGFYQRSFVGNNTTTAYNVYGVTSSVVLVYINGVLVTSPADYSYANGIVTFVTAPALNDEINILVYGAVSGVSLSSLGLNSTDDLTEGSTNLYYTDARADARIAAATTTDLTEGTNLYYTDARVDARLSSGNVGNIVTTGYLAGPATFTIDPAAVGDNTGTVVIAGNLQVDGTTTTINSTTVEVDDLNLTLASGAINAAAANGAGITIDGAGATLTYDATNDEWDFNKDINVSGQATLTSLIVNGSNANRGLSITTATDDVTDNEVIFNAPAAGSGELVFQTVSQERVRIDRSGNVGIGTDSPITRLTVGDGSGTEVLTIFSGSDGEGQIRFADGTSGSAAYQGRVEYDHVNGRLNLGAGGITPFTINSSGNVGIGTNSPTTTAGGYDGGTLHIHNTGTGSSIRLTNSTTGTGTSAGMLISKWSDSKTYFTNFDSGADMVFTPTNSGGSLVSNTFVIKSDGKIGIGTSTVGSKLTVDGADEIAKFQNTGANTNVRMVSSDTGTNYITFQDTTASSGGIRYYHGNNSMTFKANDSDMVVLNSDGDWLPQTTTQDLGSTSNPWQNIYTQDMHLSNESRDTGNEIDGTKGNWTIQEGAEDLYIINNKTGKRFRFKLEELD